MKEIFYPEGSYIKHPNTKQIMDLAKQRGFTQEKIATLCGGHQSQVSKWFSGDVQADSKKLQPLIDLLCPKHYNQAHYYYSVAPFRVKVTDKTIEKIYIIAFEKRKNEFLEEIQAAHLESESGKIEERLRLLQALKAELEEIKEDNIAEEKRYEKKLEKVTRKKEAYLAGQPELQKQPEIDRETILNRQFPSPEKPVCIIPLEFSGRIFAKLRIETPDDGTWREKVEQLSESIDEKLNVVEKKVRFLKEEFAHEFEKNEMPKLDSLKSLNGRSFRYPEEFPEDDVRKMFADHHIVRFKKMKETEKEDLDGWGGRRKYKIKEIVEHEVDLLPVILKALKPKFSFEEVQVEGSTLFRYQSESGAFRLKVHELSNHKLILIHQRLSDESADCEFDKWHSYLWDLMDTMPLLEELEKQLEVWGVERAEKRTILKMFKKALVENGFRVDGIKIING